MKRVRSNEASRSRSGAAGRSDPEAGSTRQTIRCWISSSACCFVRTGVGAILLPLPLPPPPPPPPLPLLLFEADRYELDEINREERGTDRVVDGTDLAQELIV